MSDPWRSRIAPERAAQLLRMAWQASPSASRPACLIYDLDLLDRKLAALRAAFPEALHAIAIKAAPPVALLRELVAAGCGLEAASAGELALARAAGCPPERTVYDGVVRTDAELHAALDAGVAINADSLAELARLGRLLDGASPRAPVGLRINPQLGQGAIALTDVSRPGGKFGVPISDEPAITDAFARYPWLRGLHLHAGSQGYGLDGLVPAIAAVSALQDRLASACGRELPWRDIGGGLPAAYHDAAAAALPTPAEYARRLRAEVPSLFAPGVQRVTEIGRGLLVSCAFAASRVEAVKPASEGQLALIHFGADLLLRPVYQPAHWRHERLLLDAEGALRRGPSQRLTTGGPLCFAGDLLTHSDEHPPPRPGDWLLLRDTGAYTLGMWSRYCSRPRPSVLGVRGDQVVTLLPREREDELVAWWS